MKKLLTLVTTAAIVALTAGSASAQSSVPEMERLIVRNIALSDACPVELTTNQRLGLSLITSFPAWEQAAKQQSDILLRQCEMAYQIISLHGYVLNDAELVGRLVSDPAIQRAQQEQNELLNRAYDDYFRAIEEYSR